MSLQTFWFCLIAFLWAGYFLLEGFDFGVGALLLFLAHDEEDRQIMFDAIGSAWDGNEVWLVVAGAATFAAFPAWYATMFSGFYLALVLVLVCLIVRVVSFEWRTKSENPRWRATWRWANTVGSIGAALVWGVALANLVHGVPLDSAHNFTGTFWDLFRPYTVFAGVVVVLLFAFHGATFLTLRTVGEFCERSARAARKLAAPAALAGVALLAWTVVVAVENNDKSVFPPVLPAALGGVALVLAVVFLHLRRSGAAFAMTAAATVAVVATIFTGLYPRVLVSSTDFAHSLTVSNAASSHYALVTMTVTALIFMPVVLLYQAWTYYVFRARVGGEQAARNPVQALAAKTTHPQPPPGPQPPGA
jgi:cytochrome d ubiquinol oxidase subunit II